MNISDAASQSGLPVKTIRYYEDIGLVVPGRAANGYRAYARTDIHRLTFLHNARELGFSISECRQLLALWDDRARSNSEVRAIAVSHVDAIEEKIAALNAMKAELARLIDCCHGDGRPECPILEGLAKRPG